MKIGFSRELERTLVQAKNEAIMLGYGQIGTEHLLLAILERRASQAYFVLHCHDCSAEALRPLLERGTPGLPLPRGFSPVASEALLQAKQEARRTRCNAVSTEHLLLALLRMEFCGAVKLLREHGTDPALVFSDLCVIQQNTRQTERNVDMRLLEQFCDDMVARAETSDPVIGRHEEIDALIGVLVRKNKNNPALIGEPGVGKTAIVEGLAQRMAAGTVPQLLQGKRLMNLNMASVLAGTKYRGEFEERVRDIIAEIKRCGNVILFIDEMHTLVGAGSAEGAIDAAN